MVVQLCSARMCLYASCNCFGEFKADSLDWLLTHGGHMASSL